MSENFSDRAEEGTTCAMTWRHDGACLWGNIGLRAEQWEMWMRSGLGGEHSFIPQMWVVRERNVKGITGGCLEKPEGEGAGKQHGSFWGHRGKIWGYLGYDKFNMPIRHLSGDGKETVRLISWESRRRLINTHTHTFESH